MIVLSLNRTLSIRWPPQSFPLVVGLCALCALRFRVLCVNPDLFSPNLQLLTSNLRIFNHLHTLLRNGAFATPFPSITSALFPIQRGVGGSRLAYRRFFRSLLATFRVPYILPKRLSDKDRRPERAQRVEGSRCFVFNSLRTLSFYVGSNSFVCRSYENCRGVGVFFPIRNASNTQRHNAQRRLV